MKNKIYILGLLVSIVLISSCSSLTKVTVYGTPGTEIRTPGNDYLCTIGDSGKGIVKLNRDVYYAFLLSKSPNSNEYIPFGMDYKNHNKGYIGEGIAYTLVGVSIIGSTVGAVGLIAGEGVLAGAGLAVGLAGALSLPIIYNSYLYKGDMSHSFKYKDQRTNNDLFKVKQSEHLKF